LPPLRVPRAAGIGRVAQAVLLGIAGMGLLVPAAGAAGAQVRIVEPAAGATVNAASVPVALAVEGANLPADATRWPGPGLFHVALDGVDVLQTQELRFTLLAIPPGAHHLRVTLEGATPPVAPAEIAFTAQVVTPPAGASWLGAGGVAVAGAVMLVALLLLWLFWVRPQRVEELPDLPPGEPRDPAAPEESIELEPPQSR
jgi:hypothetical protein